MMRITNKEPWPLFVYLLSLLSLFLYLYGFFPLDYSTNTKKLDRSAQEKIVPQTKQIDKLAFIVIDAFRYDFVLPQNGENYMPFLTSSILNNQTCLIKTRTHAPTVTMPRLKAITSGTVSTYIDVVLNFISSDFKENNFIHNAANNGLKIIFYGDDTWLKLFPNTFFRSEGTNSFFTSDFTEVDNNVTRHIDEEFRKNDWDVMILHYLGLDHIGHIEGPKSFLIQPKLLEMDNIIKEISAHFKKLKSNEGIKTMVVVTGDHGMKDTGSHGGVSYSEITVPLISVENPCEILPGWPEDDLPFQVDIAPTISALLGLPNPTRNMGKIIPSLLHGMKREDIFKILETNRLELSKFESVSDKGLELNLVKEILEDWLADSKKDENIGKLITQKYFHCLHQLSEKILSSNSNFKMFHLALSVGLMWLCSFNLLYVVLRQFSKPQNKSHWFLIFGTISHSLSFISTSFIEEEHQTWYFFWVTFCILLLLQLLNSGKHKSAHKLKLLLPWITITLIHRFLRKLNQTGDKWASLPDIKSYLNSEEGQTWLLAFFLLGMGLLCICAAVEGCSFLQLLTFIISLVAVIGYRISIGSFHVKHLGFYPLSRGISEVIIFWTALSIFATQTFRNRTPIYLIWVLLISLVFRPHNIILVPIEVFISKQINKLFKKPDELMWNNVAHVWLGNLFYFYQGNGNTLANIDVASGFVGMQSYNPMYAVVMMTAHTSNGHILSFMLSPKSNLLYATLRLIPLTLYCTFLLFQLHHLFIWSVFSPKLLYETNTTLTIFFLMLFSSFNLVKHDFQKNIC